MADGPNFDGTTPVPGYTLFKGKDGSNFYLKGENLEPDDVTQRVAKLRGQTASATIPGAPDGLPQPSPGVVGNPEAAAKTMQPSNLGTIATGAPLMSMQPGLPSPAQVPENARAMQIGSAIGAPVGGLIAGGTAALPGIARGIAGSAVVGGAGNYYGNKLFGPVGGEILGTLGGLAGGYAGVKGMNVGGGRLSFLESLMGGKAPTGPVQDYVPPAHTEIPLGHPDYPGPNMPIPMRMPKPATGPDYVPPAHTEIPLGSPEYPGPNMKIPLRMRATPKASASAPAKNIVDVTDPASDPQDLISRMKKLVIPGEEPTAGDLKRAGDLTQAPLPVLKNLAKFGDKLAQNEMTRRLRLGK